jgi:hypothetical protein
VPVAEAQGVVRLANTNAAADSWIGPPAPADSTAARVKAAPAPSDSIRAARAAQAQADSVRARWRTDTPADSLARSKLAAVDSSAAEVERVLREAAAQRKARHRQSAHPRGRFDAPRWVMFRSALVPGWGQLHNRAWIKAIGVSAGEVALAARILKDEKDLDRLSRAADAAQEANDEVAFDAAVTAYNELLTQSIGRRWFLGGVLAYALVDAYVDAHFTNFNVDFDTAWIPGESGAGFGARVRLGWSF